MDQECQLKERKNSQSVNWSVGQGGRQFVRKTDRQTDRHTDKQTVQVCQSFRRSMRASWSDLCTQRYSSECMLLKFMDTKNGKEIYV